MVLIIKKLVPVYSEEDDVPKKYRNLRKPKHVTSFKYIYPNIIEILQNEYGLKLSDHIIVYWMKEISLPHFNRYRLPFKKVYSGKLSGFRDYIESWKEDRSETENE